MIKEKYIVFILDLINENINILLNIINVINMYLRSSNHFIFLENI